ncbi:MAG: phosphate/phosphite/phosphonate ABC transporter substrate-binding protein [Geminicoccales bacterium]
MTFIANARMYAVSHEVEVAWQGLIACIAEDAGTAFDYQTYPAPKPLEQLWRRADVGCVQMCGYPIARKVAAVVPLASPIPSAPWAHGKAVYRTDLIVRKDASFNDLTDSFSGTVGWTVEHSHSGFNALRYHLLPYRSKDHAKVYRASIGHLITARRVIESVLDGTIDIGPLDAYWHMLTRKFQPELTAGIRVLESTATLPMPAFVASQNLQADIVERLREAFRVAHSRPWFDQFRDRLLIEGFSHVTHETFADSLTWNRAAEEAGYMEPA